MSTSNVFRVLITTILIGGGLVLPDPIVADEEPTPVDWYLTTIYLGRDHQPRGKLLSPGSSQETAVAFRCQDRHLYALLSTTPVNFQRKLLDRSNPRERKVRFSINGGEEQSEEWIQLSSGQVYMVREAATSAALLEVARTGGGTIAFTRKYKDEVVSNIQSLKPLTYEQFKDSCALGSQYLVNG